MIVSPASSTAHSRRIAAVFLAIAASLVLATSVRAHAELVSSSPAPNAVLTATPAEVTLTFSEPIDPDTAFVDLLDPEQRRVAGVGTPAVTDAGRTVTVALPDLDTGAYTVSYQVVSSVDGHATTGILAFLVDPDGTEVAPTVPPTSSSPSVDLASIVARWIGLAAALVALGSLVMWAHAGRSALADRAPGAPSGPPWRLVAVSAIVAFGGITAYLVLSARPIVEAVGLDGFSLDPAAPFGWTPYAIAMRFVLAGTLLAGLVAGVRSATGDAVERATDRSLVATVALLLAVALAGMSMAGHAAASGGLLAGALDWVHLVAVASWLGGLPAALVLALRARGGSAGSAGTTAGAILRRHGRLAIVAAPIVALTGIANSPLVLGGSRDLVASDYGNLVLAKAMLLAVAVGIGAINHVTLRGRRRAAIAGLVAAELAVAVLAVGAAATMVTIQPAAGRQGVLLTTQVNPAHLFGAVGPSSLHVTVNLPSPGNQLYQASIVDLETGGPRDDIQLVFMELTPPAPSGLPTTGRVELEATDTPGLYEVGGAYTSIEGDWVLEVTVRRAGSRDERVAFVLPITSPGIPEIGPPPNTGIAVPGPVGALWPFLPPGPMAWLPVVAALGGLWLLARSRAPQLVRWTAGGVLLGIVLVTGAAAGSRAIVTAANAPPTLPPPTVPTDAEALARGEGLYLANCAACHGRDGTGGGPVRTLPPAGSLAEPVRRMSAAELGYRIADGLPGTPMPAFAGSLSQDERLALVGYLRDRWIDE